MNIRSMLRRCALALCSLPILLLAGNARAEEYRYSFVTSPFTTTAFFPRASPDVPQDWTFESRLVVSVFTDGLLTGPAGEADIRRFEITWLLGAGAPPISGGTLGSPFPDPGWVCCSVYTEYTWNMNIGSLDASGLPATWDIWINRYEINPQAQVNFRLASSNTGNSLSQVADSYFYINGSDNVAPGATAGVWSVALVPEPGTGALMLVGIAVAGLAAGRRRTRAQTQ